MIKYTIIANEDGREKTQYIESRRPLKTINVEPVNELVAPEENKDYWDAFREVVHGGLKDNAPEVNK